MIMEAILESSLIVTVGRKSYTLVVGAEDRFFVERAAAALHESASLIANQNGTLSEEALILYSALSVTARALKEVEMSVDALGAALTPSCSTLT